MIQPQSIDSTELVGGNYELQRLIGRGGMSEVYSATDILRGRQCAVKLIKQQLLDAALREVRSLRLVRHRNVVQLYEAGRHQDQYFIAMELLEGETLRAVVAKRGSIDPAYANDVLEQVARALEVIHSRSIIHCDLKPENIICHRSRTDETLVKVLDFGIATLRDRSEDTLLAGTPEYMAPEQFLTSDQIGPATDVFAYGLLAYFLLTGKSYWKTANIPPRSNSGILREIRETMRNRLLPRMSERVAESADHVSLPNTSWDRFDAWLSSCLALAPSERFQTINEAYAALRSVLRAPVVLGVQSTTPAPPTEVPGSSEEFVTRLAAEIQRRVPYALQAMQEAYIPELDSADIIGPEPDDAEIAVSQPVTREEAASASRASSAPLSNPFRPSRRRNAARILAVLFFLWGLVMLIYYAAHSVGSQ